MSLTSGQVGPKSEQREIVMRKGKKHSRKGINFAGALDEEAEKLYDSYYNEKTGGLDMSRADEAAQGMTAEQLFDYAKDSRDGTNGKVKMPTTAIKYFIQAAQKGHTPAKYELACMYEKGIGYEVDIEKAKEYYSSAALFGHDKAKRALKRLERKSK